VTQQHEFGGVAPRDLAAEFASDRTARACDQYAPAPERRADRLIIDPHRLAAQEVGDVHFTQAGNVDLAADQFVDARHGARGDALLAADIVDHADESSRCGGNGNDDLVNAVLVDGGGEVVHPADHGHAVDDMPLFGGVVVEKADRGQVQLGGSLKFTHDQRTRVARADDEGALGLSVCACSDGLFREDAQAQSANRRSTQAKAASLCRGRSAACPAGPCRH
jgi:hypothetical protein